ncbi:Helix-turn-helix domain-containing protein [Verrucomicrobium sp. GAS474]|nr:Helix-turn-helix domain-containing protein [Verrucomicrobium sp. GAS474]
MEGVASSAPYKHLGRNLKRLRTALKVTQEKAAEKVGVSLKYWQALEAGSKAPAFSTLSRIRKTLGTSWEELCRDC